MPIQTLPLLVFELILLLKNHFILVTLPYNYNVTSIPCSFFFAKTHCLLLNRKSRALLSDALLAMHIKCKLRIHSPLRSSLIATTSSQPFYFKEQKTRFLQMYNS